MLDLRRIEGVVELTGRPCLLHKLRVMAAECIPCRVGSSAFLVFAFL